MRGPVAAGALCAAALSLALAYGAFAVMPPQVYADARRDAEHHIQMRIDDVKGLGWFQDHGACEVRGEVVRVFRGDLEVGAPLTLAVDCAKPKARLAPGPQLWTPWRALREAGYLEAFLTEEGEIALWQSQLLSEPSDAPACDLEGTTC